VKQGNIGKRKQKAPRGRGERGNAVREGERLTREKSRGPAADRKKGGSLMGKEEWKRLKKKGMG